VEQIPQALEVVFHLTAASHDVAAGRIVDTVAGTAGDVHGFQNVDVIAFHLAVSYEEARCCEGCEAASYEVCALLIDAFRFFRSCEGFVVSVGVINAFAVFLIFSALGVAVIILWF